MKKIISIAIIIVFTIPVIFTGCSTKSKQTNIENSIKENAYEYFCEILSIPHGSGNEQEISDYLVTFAKEHDLEVIQDDFLNILIKKNGSKGREDESPIILQAHMDMVCEKNNNVNHNFLTDPIIPIIDGDWVSADGTTLGADDASGLSILLAVLMSDDLSHPPIEAVITTGEETGMTGAVNFNTSLLKGNRLINLDSEEEGVFTVSCASTCEVNVLIPAKYENISEEFITYSLTISGLTGGHSGLDINKNRANANVLIARLLEKMKDIEFYVSDINGGSQKNAIPRECTTIISFKTDDFDNVNIIIAEAEALFKSEYPFDEGLTITFEKVEMQDNVMTDVTSKKLVEAILNILNGVQSMSPNIEGLVQTSNNLGVVTTSDESIKLTYFLRSSLNTEQEQILDEIQQLGNSINANVNIDKQSPAWEYKEDSPLRDTMSKVHEQLYKKQPAISAIHAGLECAVFSETMEDCDLISIGVDIIDGHSPNERMSISSYNRMCVFLIKILESI